MVGTNCRSLNPKHTTRIDRFSSLVLPLSNLNIDPTDPPQKRKTRASAPDDDSDLIYLQRSWGFETDVLH